MEGNKLTSIQKSSTKQLSLYGSPSPGLDFSVHNFQALITIRVEVQYNRRAHRMTTVYLESLMDIFYSEDIPEEQGKEFRNRGTSASPSFMVKLGVKYKFSRLRQEKVEHVMFTTS